MSGSITTIDYSVLFAFDSGSQTSSLLSAIYGTGATTTAAGNSLQALQTAELNQTQDIATTAKQPAVARDIAAFNAAVASAKTPAALLQNPTVLKVLLTANGLAAQLPYTALAQKALLSDTTKSNSLAAQLGVTTPAWKTVAATYDFANKGLSVLQQPKVLSTIANGYAEISWRTSLDATTPGLSSALTFRAEASTISSVDQILGDPIMRDVVTTALGIPQEIAFQSLQAQEQAVSNRLDLTKLKDAHFVDTLTQQYLLNKANATNTTTATPTLDQLASQAAGLVV